MTSRSILFAFAAVVAFTVTAGGLTSGTPTGRSACKPVTFISAADDVTVSWKISAAATVHLRLYRLDASDDAVLVEETVAHRGVSFFKVVDSWWPPGALVYKLCVVNRVGEETTLASALCVKRQLAPRFDSAPSPSGHEIACTEEAVDPLVLSSSGVDGRRVVVECGWNPAPDPQVPRVS